MWIFLKPDSGTGTGKEGCNARQPWYYLFYCIGYLANRSTNEKKIHRPIVGQVSHMVGDRPSLVRFKMFFCGVISAKRTAYLSKNRALNIDGGVNASRGGIRK